MKKVVELLKEIRKDVKEIKREVVGSKVYDPIKTFKKFIPGFIGWLIGIAISFLFGHESIIIPSTIILSYPILLLTSLNTI